MRIRGEIVANAVVVSMHACRQRIDRAATIKTAYVMVMTPMVPLTSLLRRGPSVG